MSDAYGPSASGAMLRRSLFVAGRLRRRGGYIPARYFGSVDFSTGSGSDSCERAVDTPHTRRGRARMAFRSPSRLRPRAIAAQHAASQFYVTGSINGNTIHFLVDTGATWVALTQDDAKLLGFNLANLKWDVRTQHGERHRQQRRGYAGRCSPRPHRRIQRAGDHHAAKAASRFWACLSCPACSFLADQQRRLDHRFVSRRILGRGFATLGPRTGPGGRCR